MAMDPDDSVPSGITARIAGLFELLTTLDRRLLTTLDFFEQMQGALGGLEGLRDETDGLVDDVRRRIEVVDDRVNRMLDDVKALLERGGEVMTDVEKRIDSLDRRVHRDLDDFRAVIDTKLGDLDLLTFVTRFDRLEQAVLNIEEATTNLDRAVEGTVGSLPEFVQKRVREEGRKIAPAGARDVPP